jgi:aspartate/methionine/tyrosine aminotransferase
MIHVDPFDLLLDKIHDYRINHNESPIWISGWNVEDEKISPPLFLKDRFKKLPLELVQYAFINEAYKAKESTANSLRHIITIQGNPVQASNIAIVPSGTQGLLLILTTFRDLLEIRRLIVVAPGYFAFTSIAEHLKIESSIIPSDDFFKASIPFEQLKTEANQSKQGIVLTNPAYGVGIERHNKEYQTLFQLLSSQTPILLDETSLGLSWDNRGPWDMIDIPENVVILRSPSKLFLMHGRKFSFIVASPSIVRYIESIAEYLIGSVSGNIQEDAMTYMTAITEWQNEIDSLKDGMWMRWKQTIVNRIQYNLSTVRDILEVAGFQLSLINSAYYVLVGKPKDQFKEVDSIDILKLCGVVYTWSDGFCHISPSLRAFRTNLAGNPLHVSYALKKSLPIILKEYPYQVKSHF